MAYNRLLPSEAGCLTSVGHAHDHIVNPLVCRPVDEGFHARYEGFAAFQAKSFGSAVLLGQEALEHFAPSQPIQNVELLLRLVLELQQTSR